MLSAVDAPKSKSITIAFMALKAMLLGLLLCISFEQVNNESNCSQTLTQSSNVFKIFFMLAGLLDLFLLIWFLCTSRFTRLEYYVMFGFHFIVGGFTFIYCLIQSFSSNDCIVKNPYLGTVMAISAVFIVSAFFVMWCNLYFSLKFAHLGCNVIWTIFWIQCAFCGHILIGMIGIIHVVLSLIGLICFVVMNFMKKTSKTAKMWKQLYILSIILMIVCYVASFIGEPTSKDCMPGHLFFLTYQKFGAVEIISPVLLLMFLHTEMGDPRDNIMNREVKVFGRNRQN